MDKCLCDTCEGYCLCDSCEKWEICPERNHCDEGGEQDGKTNH
jgi:hypothetical protein